MIQALVFYLFAAVILISAFCVISVRNPVHSVLFFFLWTRATFPRYRYDQLMRLGWKIFLPFTLFWVVVTSGLLMAMDALPQ